MPEVSVIVPFYKAEKTIEKCARSLFEQTLDDIEFLFVDDCSPDGSLRVLETVLEDYPSRKSQVRILKTDSNSGSALARVLGIEKAAGEYLIHCDGDDEVERTMYKTMSEKARQEDSDFVWCDFFRDGPQSFSSSESASCAAQSCLSRGNQIAVNQYFTRNNLSLIGNLLSGRFCGALWNKLIRRTIFNENDFTYPRKSMNEDMLIVVQALFYSKKPVHVAVPLYHYCVSSLSMTSTKTDVEGCLAKFNQSLENDLSILSFLEEKNLSSRFRTEEDLLKFYCKDNLRPITGIKKYYDLWRDTFSEINRRFLFERDIPFSCKRKFFESLTRTYSFNHSGRGAR